MTRELEHMQAVGGANIQPSLATSVQLMDRKGLSFDGHSLGTHKIFGFKSTTEKFLPHKTSYRLASEIAN